MKDLDFDELDRAVNSLLTTGPGASQPASALLAQPTVATAPDPVPDAKVSQPQSTLPLAAKRSSGRFMDVVHPSSDMRTATTGQPVVRELSPRLSLNQTVSSTRPDMNAVLTASEAIASPAVAPVSSTTDPLVFNGQQQSASSSIAAETVPVDPSVPQPTDPSPVESIEPLESPFLPDAKVDKRPLGAFSIVDELNTPQPAAINFAPTPAVDSLITDNQLPVTNNQEVTLPDELKSDLLTIESKESIPKQFSADTQTPAYQPLQSSVLPIEPVSIAAQYVEQPSTGDQPVVGSIFDTEEYKKPLARTKKKGSEWLVVMWIILLLIIGAGAGAAVYFYVLPQL